MFYVDLNIFIYCMYYILVIIKMRIKRRIILCCGYAL